MFIGPVILLLQQLILELVFLQQYTHCCVSSDIYSRICNCIEVIVQLVKSLVEIHGNIYLIHSILYILLSIIYSLFLNKRQILNFRFELQQSLKKACLSFMYLTFYYILVTLNVLLLQIEDIYFFMCQGILNM